MIGDHWSLQILWDIILADRLKRLVAAGLLTREDAGRGRRDEDQGQGDGGLG